MLREGVSLSAIGALLRHASIETTTIYAKVDIDLRRGSCNALAGGAAMLSNAVNTYLSVRRALGFKLKTVEGYLRSYAAFATVRGDIRVVSNTAIEWAGLATLQNQRANRLNVVIRFARFARAEDDRLMKSHLPISSAAGGIAEPRISLPTRKFSG